MSIQPNLLMILFDLPNLKELFLASTSRVNELEDRGVVVNYLAAPDIGAPDARELLPLLGDAIGRAGYGYCWCRATELSPLRRLDERKWPRTARGGQFSVSPILNP